MKNTPNTPSKGKARKRPLSHSKYQFGNIAMKYYPSRGYKKAVALLRHEIEVTRGLLPALKENGYHEHQRILSPRQVKVIEKFLGEA